jgi:hypothetical protein
MLLRKKSVTERYPLSAFSGQLSAFSHQLDARAAGWRSHPAARRPPFADR